jgi:hypothetical protein
MWDLLLVVCIVEHTVGVQLCLCKALPSFSYSIHFGVSNSKNNAFVLGNKMRVHIS